MVDMPADGGRANLNPEPLSPQALYRGLYVRIASKLHVDPSYVSRVARGERQSKAIERALQSEIDQINKKLGRGHASHALTNRAAGKRLHFLVKHNRDRIQKEWLRQCEADHNLKKIKLSRQRRLSPVRSLIDEAYRVMKLSARKMSSNTMKAATEHGCTRREQGYSPTELLEEYNLVRRCIFELAQDYNGQLDTHFLVHDLGQIGEALDLQMQSALKAYTGQA
jgi:hypothetical protein